MMPDGVSVEADERTRGWSEGLGHADAVAAYLAAAAETTDPDFLCDAIKAVLRAKGTTLAGQADVSDENLLRVFGSVNGTSGTTDGRLMEKLRLILVDASAKGGAAASDQE